MTTTTFTSCNGGKARNDNVFMRQVTLVTLVTRPVTESTKMVNPGHGGGGGGTGDRVEVLAVMVAVFLTKKQ